MTNDEVAHRLHCSFATVKAIAAAGLITDKNPEGLEGKKHYANYRRSDVEAVAGMYRRRMSIDKLKELMSGPRPGPVVRVRAVKPEPVPVPSNGNSARNGIITRLEQIEVLLKRVLEALE